MRRLIWLARLIEKENWRNETSLSVAALALPASAETCAFDQSGWSPVSNDSSPPADDIILMSIGLDATGEFEVKSAKRRSGFADWSWQVAALASDLRPRVSPAGTDATPFDLVVSAGTIVVFQLEPGAWSFEADGSKALFLKSRANGSAYPHNPFSAAAIVGGNPRQLAVRFSAPGSLSGCAYNYNLGVMVKQGGKRTPLVIDPKISNGGGGGGN